MRVPWIFAAGLALAASAAAAPTDPGDQARSAAPKPGTQRLAGELAGEFGVPESEIGALRAQGLGWGEIGRALAIARRAGVSLDDVLTVRRSGKSWDQVASKYNMSLADLTTEVRRIERMGRAADGEDRAGRRPGAPAETGTPPGSVAPDGTTPPERMPGDRAPARPKDKPEGAIDEHSPEGGGDR